MTDRDDFLAWVKTALYEAELALHNGDAARRRALWFRNEPVSILERSFSDCKSYTFGLQAYDVVGEMAYTALRELFK